MSYIDFKSNVKKVNLKPNGVKEIVLEVNGNALQGKLDKLSEMIDCKVAVQLESEVVNFSVNIDARTEKPITEYKVDEKGVVSEVEKKQEQMEADLGLPKEKRPTKEKHEQTEREKIDEFILAGMAPSYDDLPYDFEDLIKRRLEGESYMKLASELEISSGKIVEILDEYRRKVAPLALKWWEWKQEEVELANEDKPEEEEKEKPNIPTDDSDASDQDEDDEDKDQDEEHGAA